MINLTEHSAASSFGLSLRGAWQIKYSSHIFRYWTLKVQQTTAFRNGKKFSLFRSCTYVLTCAYKSPTTAKLQTHSRHFFPKPSNIFGNDHRVGKWNMEDLHDVKFPINIYFTMMYANRTYFCTSSWKASVFLWNLDYPILSILA